MQQFQVNTNNVKFIWETLLKYSEWGLAETLVPLFVFFLFSFFSQFLLQPAVSSEDNWKGQHDAFSAGGVN